jgi:GNAT superfamily N-acetyltransferase
MIFVLEDKKDLLGGGIIEKGMVCRDCASIGMFVNRDFRGQGYAPVILLKLKEWCYHNGFKPVAGCWYPNTLSRKSLEAAGMICVSIGFEAILTGKEKLPLRTGNPPGELVAAKNESYYA